MNPEDIPLRDLHLPEPLGWWPLAPAWWLLLVLAAAALLWFAVRALRQWHRGRARRIAIRELDKLVADHKNTGDLQRLASGLSALLRRSMLAYAPRSDVASLTGDDWLRWLDRGMTQPLFSDGPGRSLDSLPYRAPHSVTDDVDVDALLRAVRERLSTPLPGEAG